jgi:hypothetical protein
MRPKRIFVYAVTGDHHVEALNRSLAFLKHFSRSDILVVRSRSSYPVAHDQVIDAEAPSYLDDHQASIYVKTSLTTLVGSLDSLCCYLDSDVAAVSDAVDDIFKEWAGPVTFCTDHIAIDTFSRHAVRCRCAGGKCSHLRKLLRATFEVEVACGEWRHWNGGVFLFDRDSGPFMKLWHDNTMLIFDDPAWRTRDQGTLIATTWMMGLQDQKTLPRTFNFIVDPYWGISSSLRASLAPTGYAVNNDYSLDGEDSLPKPALLHFVNGGMGKAGWKNWDQAAALLERRVSEQQVR